MKKNVLHKLVRFMVLLVAAVSISSCVSKKNVTYLQGADAYSDKPFTLPTTYGIKIQPDDRLSISISASEKELLEPFTTTIMLGGNGNNGGGVSSQGLNSAGFIVDKQGNIDLPVFGQVYVEGLTRVELARKIEDMLKTGGFVQDPIVKVAITSFKVVVIGEAGNTTVTSEGERLTLIEAIAKSGGVKLTGKRQNVLVMRETKGKVKTYRVDLASAEKTLSSPVYYLQQNDVICVEPNGASRVDASPFYRYMAATSSIIGFLTTITSIILLADRLK